MPTETKRTAGNTVFRDTAYSPAASLWDDCPILAALQDPNVGCLYDNHFQTYDAADFTITGESGYTAVVGDAAGGVLVVTTDGDDNDGAEFQLGGVASGESCKLAVGKPLWFEARIRRTDVSAADCLVGLCVTDTDLITDASDYAMADGVYFGLEDDGAIDYYCEGTSTETTGDTGANMTDNTWVRLGITWDGVDTVSFWVNGAIVASSTTNIPTTEIRPSFGIKNVGGAASELDVDYIKVFQVL